MAITMDNLSNGGLFLYIFSNAISNIAYYHGYIINSKSGFCPQRLGFSWKRKDP